MATNPFFIIPTLFIIWPDGVMGVCNTIPRILDSSHNATGLPGPFADGSAIQFTCNPEYTGVGSSYFYCRGSEWAGNFSCLRVCPQINSPQHGSIVGDPANVVNTSLKFACQDGYTIVGSSSMLCREDGIWKPEDPPICDPVKCKAFGSIPNGKVFNINPDGALNDFGSEFKISCNDDYNLIGSPTVTCKSDGKWSSSVECVHSVCGTHPGSKSQCIHDSTISIKGRLLSLICRENSTNISVTVVGTRTVSEIPNAEAYCLDKQWDNPDMGCFCDCLVDTDSKGLTYHNLFNKKFVKHGDNLIWECGEGYKKQVLTNISCNDSHIATPYCIRVEKGPEIPVWQHLLWGGIVIVLSLIITLVCIMWKKQCFTNQKQRITKNQTDPSETDRLCDPQPIRLNDIQASCESSCTTKDTINSSRDLQYTKPDPIQSIDQTSINSSAFPAPAL